MMRPLIAGEYQTKGNTKFPTKAIASRATAIVTALRIIRSEQIHSPLPVFLHHHDLIQQILAEILRHVENGVSGGDPKHLQVRQWLVSPVIALPRLTSPV